MNRKIRDIVKDQAILTATADLSVREATRRMADAKVGAIMITAKGGKLAGIFTERDALVKVLANGVDPDKTTLAQVMTSDPTTANADKNLGYALHMMYDGGFRHVPVVDNGVPVGMISARDALGPEMVEFEAEIAQRQSITELL
ncbi:cyclic nucleotide-binding/CBS domain-containing protein [Azoarcus sp. KH32C]|uniref:CBS domain-containing protein n=1 Tax=Azoarcus sp. KH32C TaxID=748247 RepID=UPI0002386C70|nr:CBS domain-containing protein [Azoarcus sp. KH32C]BAL24373.1 putative inosine-5'-monophosphate dehydrogenase related protein [Azoarcus sp. KH32C]